MDPQNHYNTHPLRRLARNQLIIALALLLLRSAAQSHSMVCAPDWRSDPTQTPVAEYPPTDRDCVGQPSRCGYPDGSEHRAPRARWSEASSRRSHSRRRMEV